MPTNNVQPTYAETMPRGYPGQVANGEASNRISRTNEDATPIPFGAAVFRGAGANGCTATPSAGGFLGIAIADKTQAPATPGGAVDVFPQYANVPILNEGVIWVTAGEAVTQGAPAHVSAAKAIIDTAGGGAIAIPAEFDEPVASGAVCKLRVYRGVPVAA